jgi:hypothetical protein
MAVVQARLAQEAQLQVVSPDGLQAIAADHPLLDQPEQIYQAEAPACSARAVLAPVAGAIIAAFVAAASTWLVIMLQLTSAFTKAARTWFASLLETTVRRAYSLHRAQ